MIDYKSAKEFILGRLEKELSPKLSYHGLHHTMDVLDIAIELCEAENIDHYETQLVKTAALFHDCGFIQSNVEHEMLGCEIVRDSLETFGYSNEEIEKICGMIMSTKIPQSPKTKLEEILCDADLDYLGRPDFYKIANSLFQELKAFGNITTEEVWNRIQVGFIGKHSFYTATNKKRREPQKQVYLSELIQIVSEYE